jgi:hypothetical protein
VSSASAIGNDVIRAGYLPGLDASEVEWEFLKFERGLEQLTVAVPTLTQAQTIALTRRVRTAPMRYLAPMPVTQIISVIDAAIHLFLDRQGPYRKQLESALPIITGYDPEMIRLALTAYLKTFRGPELARFVTEDLPNPLILDRFVPALKGGYVKAYGPTILVHVWAGNVPALPLWSFVCGLLVKAGNIGKLPSAEPLFAGLFAQAVAEVEPELADCFSILWWKGGDDRVATNLYESSDVVLAYGGNSVLTQIAERVPLTTRYLPFGHKISFSVIAAQALDSDKSWRLAHAAEFDVGNYDQHGCYSPQLIYVERGGTVSPREFSNYLAHELEAFATRYPRRTLSIEEARDVAAWWHKQELSSLADSSNALLGTVGASWNVV